MADDKRVRLRASCNACNESKVRCSQGKPTCTRCEKNDIDCVYGLSRRTHKDAPPIVPPAPQRGRKAPRTANSVRRSVPTVFSGNDDSEVGRNGNSGPPDQLSEAQSTYHLDFPDDFTFTTTTDFHPTQDATNLVDFNNFVNNGAIMAPGDYVSTTGGECNESTPPEIWESLTGISSLGGAMEVVASNVEAECTCHAAVTDPLASFRGRRSTLEGEQKFSLTSHFANLKERIAASEISMRCAHTRENLEPIHILPVAILIAYIIDDFKVLGTAANSSGEVPQSPSCSSSSTITKRIAGTSVPGPALLDGITRSGPGLATVPNGNSRTAGKLAIGGLVETTLELEEDEEQELRQRLYLLSFRKLEKLLSQLDVYLREQRGSLLDSSGRMAFVTACDYISVWLAKSAAEVKRHLLAQSPLDQSRESTFA